MRYARNTWGNLSSLAVAFETPKHSGKSMSIVDVSMYNNDKNNSSHVMMTARISNKINGL